MKTAMILKTQNGYLIVEGDCDLIGTEPKVQDCEVSETLNKVFDLLCLFFEGPKTEETKQP
jgi:hypothetical protein